MQTPPPWQSAILEVITLLNAAVSNSRLYTCTHPQVSRYLQQAHDQLDLHLARKPELTFFMVDRELVVENQPLAFKTPQVAQFVQTLERAGVERITFLPGIARPELVQLVFGLASDHQETLHSTPGIKLGKVEMSAAPPPEQGLDMTPEMQARIEKIGIIRDRSLDQLKDLYHLLKAQKQVTVSGFEEIVQSFVRGIGKNLPPLQVLASLKSSDEYTFTHAVNVCILTMTQAEALGIEGKHLYDIGIAASLHDAGKVFVADEILNKPGKLSEQEWVHMRNHTIRGARQILRIDGLPRLAFLGALEHHIRFDGSGYPVLDNWRPNLVSQMIAIADMFDAMRSRRPYQAPKPDALIFDIMRKESGTAFNPRLVQNFLQLIG